MSYPILKGDGYCSSSDWTLVTNKKIKGNSPPLQQFYFKNSKEGVFPVENITFKKDGHTKVISSSVKK